MNARSGIRRAVRWTAGAAGVAAAGYCVLVANAWARYGHPPKPSPDEVDPLLDRFMPEYDVTERHTIAVNAPSETTLAAAREADLQASPLVRGIFRLREIVLGAQPDTAVRPRGLLAETQSMGWRILAEQPGHEIVVGAVTRPWVANVSFRGLNPEEFRAFAEPGYVKIAWTLRVDPTAAGTSIFRTETRVTTTDAEARRKFRWYWARFSPGIALIRTALLGPLKADAERRSSFSRS